MYIKAIKDLGEVIREYLYDFYIINLSIYDVKKLQASLKKIVLDIVKYFGVFKKIKINTLSVLDYIISLFPVLKDRFINSPLANIPRVKFFSYPIDRSQKNNLVESYLKKHCFIFHPYESSEFPNNLILSIVKRDFSFEFFRKLDLLELINFVSKALSLEFPRIDYIVQNCKKYNQEVL